MLPTTRRTTLLPIPERIHVRPLNVLRATAGWAGALVTWRPAQPDLDRLLASPEDELVRPGHRDCAPWHGSPDRLNVRCDGLRRGRLD